MSDIAQVHRRALDATGRIVAQIRPDQMTHPTPCEDWDVRALLNHVVSGNLWAAELGQGGTIEGVGDRLDGDLVGDAPHDAYDRSAAAAAQVFEAPGALDAPCAVSYGPVPGSVYAGHRFIDVLIHGWDLAKATGQDTTLDPELVDACFEVLEPELDALQGSGEVGEAVDVPADAPPQTRLLALLGRHA
ncbi:MAG TPA: TIGR03086 family metal-binding protein [Acidimicrobiales bacterium]|jgi:uncharacterized protein (TIGR03086 family)|nr:TIGR03086 family metal-binding protein [Acidimicrobiales bacterium]